ncbi:LysR family substrate-binding domain-containing protein [Streptomyces montanisoli]|uniref:LysR family substrate-binding domain-containing protein n=1 Tax=Streptomyces montanisoli TaxID=2798581 RepID=A0A940M7C2_9ACTN|nr:LysR family substrate-binding domain-containing protein [Streptomyces montanisoli]MBP0457529.1 LysR family substrate-binding domain-containing protein [Streptomyces montanisoli]
MTGTEGPTAFRLAYVPGVTPSKWVRIWQERVPGVPLVLHPVTAAQALGVLRERGADAGFVRLPVDGDDLSAIPLYTETTVVVAPKDHVVAAVDEVSADDLADEVVLHPLDDTLGWERPPGLPALQRAATTADAVELVAAGVGLLVVPQSLARLHHRRDLTYRPLLGVPESRIALSWPRDATTEHVETFIGIVRGRTVNSSRGRPANPPAKPAAGSGRGDSGRRGSGAGKAAGGAAGKNRRTASGRPERGRRGKPRRRS